MAATVEKKLEGPKLGVKKYSRQQLEGDSKKVGVTTKVVAPSVTWLSRLGGQHEQTLDFSYPWVSLFQDKMHETCAADCHDPWPPAIAVAWEGPVMAQRRERGRAASPEPSNLFLKKMNNRSRYKGARPICASPDTDTPVPLQTTALVVVKQMPITHSMA